MFCYLGDNLIKDTNQFRQTVLSEMSNYGIPYETLNRIAIDCHDIEDMKSILKRYKINRLLEIGAYVGFSTFLFRYNFPEASIISVDPNFVADADVSEEYRNGVHVRSIFDNFVAKYNIKGIERIDAYFSCLPQEKSILFHGRYNSNILSIPIVDNAILLEKGKFDLIFIDGDHYGDSVYSDLKKAKGLLQSDGIIILHDMKGKWGQEVKSGIKRFLVGNSKYIFVEVNNLGIIKKE